MKWLLASWLLVFWFVPNVYAEECTIDEQCNVDTHYTDTTTGQCIHKHGGFCDLDTNECVYAYDPEDESKCITPVPPVTPLPSTSTTSSPTITTKPPPEEQAIYNQITGLLASQKTEACELNPLQQLINSIFSIFKVQFFCPPKFFNQAKALHQSELPKELTPTGNIENRLKGFLGRPTSSYGVTLPSFTNNTDDVKQTEKRFEKAHFPPGITPITGI